MKMLLRVLLICTLLTVLTSATIVPKSKGNNAKTGTQKGKASKSSGKKATSALSAQELFTRGMDACAKEAYDDCYDKFMLFANAYPSMTEGFTNAAYALEKVNKFEEARAVYLHALELHPGSSKVITPYVNCLQVLAMKHYQDGSLLKALEAYNEIIEHIPEHPGVHLNIGTIQEHAKMYDEAKSSYVRAAEMQPESAKPLNALCRLLLTEVSGAAAGRYDIDGNERKKAFEDAKVYCAEAVRVEPDDGIANMNIGMLYKDGLEFDTAVAYLKKAAAALPDDIVVLNNLASTLSRAGDVHEALKIQKKIARLTNSPGSWFSIGTMSAPLDRLSADGLEGHRKGIELQVANTPPPPAAPCKKRVVRYYWRNTTSAIVTVVNKASPEIFGVPQPKSHRPNIGQSIPLLFHDKDTVAVELESVYMEGTGGVLYNDCETFAVQGHNTDIPRDFVGSATTTIEVSDPVICVMHKSINNHYHWLAEGLGRLLLAKKQFGEGVRLLLPSRDLAPNVWDTLATLGIDTTNAVSYDPDIGKRYFLHKVYLIDFTPSSTDPDDNDLWADYLPSRLALDTVREFGEAHQLARPPVPANQRYPVLYISRKGVREVISESLLTDRLQKLLGKNLYIFKVENPDSASQHRSVQQQIDLFSHAALVIGPHGAGLTNMVYAPRNATIAEFTMSPHCNRCFGYMAAALNMDYWVIPEVSCFYHLKYKMTKEKAEAVIQTVAHILTQKGLGHLIVNPSLVGREEL